MQKLCKCTVDSDWTDNRETRQSCSGGAVLFHGCAVLTWARTQKTRALLSALAQLYGISSGASEGLEAAQLLQEWQYKTVPLLLTDSQSALAVPQAKRAGSNETHGVEDAHSSGTVENGTTSYPQSIDSRQSSRPHDQGHDSRETDQVWTYSELARIILHRLEPTCTVTSVTTITETLTVLMNTVNSIQNHTLTAYGGNLRTTTESGIDDSPQLSTSNSVDESLKCRPSSNLQMCLYATTRTMLLRRMP